MLQVAIGLENNFQCALATRWSQMQ